MLLFFCTNEYDTTPMLYVIRATGSTVLTRLFRSTRPPPLISNNRSFNHLLFQGFDTNQYAYPRPRIFPLVTEVTFSTLQDPQQYPT